METLTNEISEKLQNKFSSELLEIAEDMRKEGATDWKIKDAINGILKQKIRDYYKPKVETKVDFNLILEALRENSPDSKAEGIFHELLERHNIPFRFHYRVGIYHIDYLIGKNLAVELDGSQHNSKKQQQSDRRKDEYLNELGYDVLRLPLIIIMADPAGCIEGIKNRLEGKR